MKTGVIIANTGSPSSPEPDDIELYLRDYLMDDRIRQLPKPMWKNIMHKHVLPKRKYSSSKRYHFVWTPEGSPLVVNQQHLVDKVQAAYDADGHDATSEDAVLVRNAMSYGTPSIPTALKELRKAGCTRIVLLPLYPQSAYSPTQAVIDAYKRALSQVDWHPATCIIDNYHDNPLYIKAIADRIRAAGFGQQPDDHLVLSLHAIPLKDEKAGDTYRKQVNESADLIAAELGVDPASITRSYQSVFGPHKKSWVSPLSEDILPTWRDESFRVFFCCPGFAVDCLETLYDIPNSLVPALEGEEATPLKDTTDGDIQSACNSKRFVWVPCLNDSEDHVRLVRNVLDTHMEMSSFTD